MRWTSCYADAKMNQGSSQKLRISPVFWMAVAVTSLVGCAHRTFYFASPDLEAGYQQGKARAPPKHREALERLEQDDTVVVHVIKGHVDPGESRGGQTNFASSKEAKRHCIMHPMFNGIPPDRNFDVIFDEEVAKQSSPQPNTVDVVLDHEIVGHIVQVLDDPTWRERSKEKAESDSRERENEYRQHNGMPLFPLKSTPQPAEKERKP